jgi:hypothetical protein
VDYKFSFITHTNKFTHSKWTLTKLQFTTRENLIFLTITYDTMCDLKYQLNQIKSRLNYNNKRRVTNIEYCHPSIELWVLSSVNQLGWNFKMMIIWELCSLGSMNALSNFETPQQEIKKKSMQINWCLQHIWDCFASEVWTAFFFFAVMRKVYIVTC